MSANSHDGRALNGLNSPIRKVQDLPELTPKQIRDSILDLLVRERSSNVFFQENCEQGLVYPGYFWALIACDLDSGRFR